MHATKERSPRWRRRLLVLMAVVGAFLLLPALRWGVIGWLRWEAFYDWMPASYWSNQISKYEHAHWTGSFSVDRIYTPNYPAWVHTAADWFGISFTQHLYRPDILRYHDPEAVPVLVALCRDSDPRVRAAVADTLGFIKPPGEETLTALRLLCEDEEAIVRERAAESLRRLKGVTEVPGGRE